MADLLRVAAGSAITALNTAKRAAIAVSDAGPDNRDAAIMALFGASTQAKATGLVLRDSRETSLRVLNLIA
jgi:hypothetical protein